MRFLVVLLLVGCAKPEWVHPEKPQQELEKDLALCVGALTLILF
jgi:hypothetical protein